MSDASSILSEIEALIKDTGNDEAYSTAELGQIWGLKEVATRRRIKIAVDNGMVEVVTVPRKQINGVVIPRRCYRFMEGKKKKKKREN